MTWARRSALVVLALFVTGLGIGWASPALAGHTTSTTSGYSLMGPHEAPTNVTVTWKLTQNSIASTNRRMTLCKGTPPPTGTFPTSCSGGTELAVSPALGPALGADGLSTDWSWTVASPQRADYLLATNSDRTTAMAVWYSQESSAGSTVAYCDKTLARYPNPDDPAGCLLGVLPGTSVTVTNPSPVPVVVREPVDLACPAPVWSPSPSPAASSSTSASEPAPSPSPAPLPASSGCSVTATLDEQQYLVLGFGAALLVFFGVVAFVKREAVPVLRG